MYVYINAACLTRRTYTRILKMTRLTRIALIKYFILYLPVKLMHIKKQIKMISITSEMIFNQLLVIDICLYFHCSFLGITSDFSIRLMLFHSELQTPITFLFVNENIKCGYSFS